MKTSHLFAALMILGCAIAAPASASTYTVSSDPTLYDVSGTLSKGTEISFTYTSNTQSPGSFLALSGDAYKGSNSASASSFVSNADKNSTSNGSTSLSSGLLTILITAAYKGVSTITIENFSNQTVNFDALFAATRLALAGSFTTSGPSPVPVPASALLFATALLGLGGFSMLRKARNQA